jgi:hypothetical protein
MLLQSNPHPQLMTTALPAPFGQNPHNFVFPVEPNLLELNTGFATAQFLTNQDALAVINTINSCFMIYNGMPITAGEAKTTASKAHDSEARRKMAAMETLQKAKLSTIYLKRLDVHVSLITAMELAKVEVAEEERIKKEKEAAEATETRTMGKPGEVEPDYKETGSNSNPNTQDPITTSPPPHSNARNGPIITKLMNQHHDVMNYWQFQSNLYREFHDIILKSLPPHLKSAVLLAELEKVPANNSYIQNFGHHYHQSQQQSMINDKTSTKPGSIATGSKQPLVTPRPTTTSTVSTSTPTTTTAALFTPHNETTTPQTPQPPKIDPLALNNTLITGPDQDGLVYSGVGSIQLRNPQIAREACEFLRTLAPGLWFFQQQQLNAQQQQGASFRQNQQQYEKEKQQQQQQQLQQQQQPQHQPQQQAASQIKNPIKHNPPFTPLIASSQSMAIKASPNTSRDVIEGSDLGKRPSGQSFQQTTSHHPNQNLTQNGSNYQVSIHKPVTTSPYLGASGLGSYSQLGGPVEHIGFGAVEAQMMMDHPTQSFHHIPHLYDPLPDPTKATTIHRSPQRIPHPSLTPMLTPQGSMSYVNPSNQHYDGGYPNNQNDVYRNNNHPDGFRSTTTTNHYIDGGYRSNNHSTGNAYSGNTNNNFGDGFNDGYLQDGTFTDNWHQNQQYNQQNHLMVLKNQMEAIPTTHVYGRDRADNGYLDGMGQNAVGQNGQIQPESSTTQLPAAPTPYILPMGYSIPALPRLDLGHPMAQQVQQQQQQQEDPNQQLNPFDPTQIYANPLQQSHEVVPHLMALQQHSNSHQQQTQQQAQRMTGTTTSSNFQQPFPDLHPPHDFDLGFNAPVALSMAGVSLDPFPTMARSIGSATNGYTYQPSQNQPLSIIAPGDNHPSQPLSVMAPLDFLYPSHAAPPTTLLPLPPGTTTDNPIQSNVNSSADINGSGLHKQHGNVGQSGPTSTTFQPQPHHFDPYDIGDDSLSAFIPGPQHLPNSQLIRGSLDDFAHQYQSNPPATGQTQGLSHGQQQQHPSQHQQQQQQQSIREARGRRQTVQKSKSTRF